VILKKDFSRNRKVNYQNECHFNVFVEDLDK